jgi:hypothetical protein
LGDAVAPEDNGSEASCNDGEKKRGYYGVFHGAALSAKDAPAIRNLPTDWGRNLPLRVLRRRIDAEVVLTSALRSTRPAPRGASVNKGHNAIDKHVGSRVRMRRLKLDLTQMQLADVLD